MTRGCRAILELTYRFSKCSECLEKEREKDRVRKGYKGIAKRSFTRDFVLADTLNVEDVTFSEGILRIILKQIIPEEQKPKKIEIN